MMKEVMTLAVKCHSYDYVFGCLNADYLFFSLTDDYFVSRVVPVNYHNHLMQNSPCLDP